MENRHLINGKDCLLLNLNNNEENALRHFVSSFEVTDSIFRFDTRYIPDEDSTLIEYDFQKKGWKAGRFIGNAVFSYEDEEYHLIIEPRFGNKFLFKMLEEIFNVRITNSQTGLNKDVDFEMMIKRLIALIWIKKLGDANKHGLPRHNVKKQHIGYTRRSKLDIRKTIIPYYTDEKMVSYSYEKEPDYVIARILLTAYEILKESYCLSSIQLPSNIRDLINDIQGIPGKSKRITENEYHNIKYKAIYMSYKDIVDLSWTIIKNRDVRYNSKNQQKGFSFFIDMAEVWELYILSILESHFGKQGWKVYPYETEVYKDTFFRRKIIPDIIMEREDKVIVLDAKYKNMSFIKNDLDRNDFFQIHTYMSYFHCHNKLLAGGLIYPLSGDIQYNSSNTLFQDSLNPCPFFIDGIAIRNMDVFEDEKIQFLERISKIVAEPKLTIS